MQQTNYRLRLPNERTSQIIVKSSKLQIRSKGKDESVLAILVIVGFLAAAESAPDRRFPYNLSISDTAFLDHSQTDGSVAIAGIV